MWLHNGLQDIAKLAEDLHLTDFEHRLTQLLTSGCLGITLARALSFLFCPQSIKIIYIYIIQSLCMLIAFIKAATPRSHVREWSYEQASGFHEHVWQTVVDHPSMMETLEQILSRPNQLVRPLGACLGENRF